MTKLFFPQKQNLLSKSLKNQKSPSNIWSKKVQLQLMGSALTVVDIDNKNLLSISLIPHTLKKTTLGIKSIGDKVNIEYDIIGKYIAKLLPKN